LIVIEVKLKFRSDPPYSCACCEYRQNAALWLVVKLNGRVIDDGGWPMKDDGYSRKDDLDGWPATHWCGFETKDYPGTKSALPFFTNIHFTFTAEQLVIDTCNNNAVVEKYGPTTMVVTGTFPTRLKWTPARTTINGSQS
jgi:hypothetical protein